MTGLTVTEVEPAHVDRIAALAAATHARARQLEPLLPSSVGEAASVRPLIAAAVESGGWVALRGDEVTAAMVGGSDGGRDAKVPILGAVGHPDDLADVYAAAAREWVNSNALRHVVMALAGDRTTTDALVGLGFGREQAYAVREIPVDGPVLTELLPDDPGLTVRRATVDDLDDLSRLTPQVTEHQELSPVFSIAEQSWYDAIAGSIATELADETAYVHLASDSAGTALGFSLSYDEPPDPVTPDDSCELSLVGVDQRSRGRGVGLTLMAAALQDARLRGRRAAHTNWRTTNLLSSRFWPRRGFRPVAYRLVRTIDLTPFG